MSTPALHELMRDMTVEILRKADNPGACGEYVTQQIRELVGVRFVLLAETAVDGSLVPVSFCPPRKSDIWQNPDFRRFVEIAAERNAPTVLRRDDSPVGSILTSLGYNECFAAPLKAGQETVGLLLLVDLLHPSGIAAILDILRDVSGVIALIFRNSILYRNLESMVIQRTQALAESEKQFRTLVENLPGVVYRCDIAAPWKVHHISEGVAQLTGRPARLFLSGTIHWADIVLPEDLPAVDAAVRHSIEQGTLYEIEYRIIRADQTLCWVGERGKAIYDAEGKPACLDGFIMDIDARKQTEAKLNFNQFAVDHAAEAAYWVKEDGSLIYANKIACRNHGYDHDELIRMSVFDLDPNYAQSEWPLFLATIRDKGTLQFETLHRRKDGSVFPVELNVSYVHFENDVYICGLARDITERKKTEQEMRQWAQLFELADFGLAIADTRKNTFTAVNPAFARERGYTPEELVGRPILTVYPPDKHEDLRARFEKYGNMRHDIFESEHLRKDGSRFPVLMEVTVVSDSAGHPVSRLAFALNISEQKNAMEARERLQQQLVQAQKMEAIGLLAGGIAHDFNNILQGIIVNLDLMKLKYPYAGFRDSADDIMALALKAADLTKGMLAYSRQQIFTLKTVDVNVVVKDAVKLLHRMLGEDISVAAQFAGEALISRLDSGQIQQVIFNLAANARDAMPRGGTLYVETSRVDVSAARTSECGIEKPGAYAVISVTDSGSGIPRKDLSHIFDPFYTTKEVGKGTGLGLAIVFGIVKQHEGSITVYSEERQGTTFRIYLPLHAGELTAPAEQESPNVGRGHERIMLVEDDLMVNTSMQKLLTAMGYQVTAFSQPDEAITEFVRTQGAVDLVILDVIMPKKSGKDVLAEMKRVRPDVKALFISGYPADFLDKKGILESHAHLLMKPVMPHALAEKIREVLGS